MTTSEEIEARANALNDQQQENRLRDQNLEIYTKIERTTAKTHLVRSLLTSSAEIESQDGPKKLSQILETLGAQATRLGLNKHQPCAIHALCLMIPENRVSKYDAQNTQRFWSGEWAEQKKEEGTHKQWIIRSQAYFDPRI